MILEELELIQGSQGDKEFAAKLGIHRISWQRIKNRRVPISDKFLVRILRAFPDMKTIVDLYILTKDIDHTGNLSTPHQSSQNKILGTLQAVCHVSYLWLKSLLGLGKA